MKKMLSLFKILLSSAYGISSFKYKAAKKKSELIKVAALGLVIVFSIFPIFYGYIAYMIDSYDALVSTGQPGVIITLGVVASSMIVLFFGFFYVISSFYFTSDTEYLVTLPLKPYQILGAKFGVVLVSEYITALPLALPPIIIYGIKSGASILYWFYSIIGALIIPVIPLCLTSIIAIVVMRVTNIGKRRDLFRIIGGVAAIFIMLGVQAYIQRAAASGNPEMLTNILFAENGLINFVSRNFPPAAWISIALVEYGNAKGAIYLLLFVAVSTLFLLGFAYLGERMFLGGYIGTQETSSKGRKLDEEQLSRVSGGKSKISALFWREFRLLNRVPVFFLNCVLPVILVPAIFIFMSFGSGNQLTEQLGPLMRSAKGIYYATIVIAGIGIFTGATSMVAPTSISREGAQFFVSKYIPVNPKDQVLSKIIHALLLIEAGSLLAIITVGVIMGVPPVNLILSIVISSLAVIPIIEIGLIIDLFRPLLVWDNPQKAVKQNLNGIISMFFNSLWVGGILFLCARFINNHLISYVLLIIVFLAAGIILYKILISYAEKRYAEIEP